jgi:hypothetical protein
MEERDYGLVAVCSGCRRCYGLELDPAYVDTVVRRWQKLSGGGALHAISGQRLDDLARQAEVANAA